VSKKTPDLLAVVKEAASKWKEGTVVGGIERNELTPPVRDSGSSSGGREAWKEGRRAKMRSWVGASRHFFHFKHCSSCKNMYQCMSVIDNCGKHVFKQIPHTNITTVLFTLGAHVVVTVV